LPAEAPKGRRRDQSPARLRARGNDQPCPETIAMQHAKAGKSGKSKRPAPKPRRARGREDRFASYQRRLRAAARRHRRIPLRAGAPYPHGRQPMAGLPGAHLPAPARLHGAQQPLLEPAADAAHGGRMGAHLGADPARPARGHRAAGGGGVVMLPISVMAGLVTGSRLKPTSNTIKFATRASPSCDAIPIKEARRCPPKRDRRHRPGDDRTMQSPLASAHKNTAGERP
jgi:hypothetical protein